MNPPLPPSPTQRPYFGIDQVLFPSLWQKSDPLQYNQRDVYGNLYFGLWNSGPGWITTT
jgi:hypothetical protein